LYSNPTFGLSETKTKLNPALLQETKKKLIFLKENLRPSNPPGFEAAWFGTEPDTTTPHSKRNRTYLTPKERTES
jgi:hypothetical protein